jgi:hypothetical protein
MRRAPHPCAALNENGFGHMQRLALVNPQVQGHVGDAVMA